MPSRKFTPDSEEVFEYLNQQGSNSVFSTIDMRVALNASTMPLNRMLLDLAERGYVEPEDYDLRKNHEWRIDYEDLDEDELGDALGSYPFSELSRETFESVGD
jgi:hypothetical protein